PRRSQLAGPVLESRKERACLVELCVQALDPADLDRHLAELARRVGVESREPGFGGADLALGCSRPTAGLIGQRPARALRAPRTPPHRAEAFDEGPICVLGK